MKPEFSAVKIHILRPDSLTPIDTYLARRDRPGAPWTTHLEAAVLLLYREREIRSAAGPDLAMGLSWNDPWDPLHLKADVSDRLARVLEHKRAHAFGWLVAARLRADLCEFDRAIVAAETAVALGETEIGHALIYDAGLAGVAIAPNRERQQRAEQARRAARAAGRRRDVRWPRKTIERFDERVRR